MYCEIPTFARCCFCLPLRRGILIFGYLNIMFTGFMVTLFSLSIHYGWMLPLMLLNSVISDYEDYINLVIYTIGLMLHIILVYGAHSRNATCLKVFCYGMLAILGALLLLQITGIITSIVYDYYLYIYLVPLFLFAMIINFYLYLMARSLLKKFENSSKFDSQLHQFVNEEVKPEGNVAYTHLP